jgi:hypothetical protein
MYACVCVLGNFIYMYGCVYTLHTIHLHTYSLTHTHAVVTKRRGVSDSSSLQMAVDQASSSGITSREKLVQQWWDATESQVCVCMCVGVCVFLYGVFTYACVFVNVSTYAYSHTHIHSLVPPKAQAACTASPCSRGAPRTAR